MNYERFCSVLDAHIFGDEKRELVKKIANNPERFIGLFRPTKPTGKILQHILQSHEIRFGDAMEELIEHILVDLGYTMLPKKLVNDEGKTLSLDQHFRDQSRRYFIEQKIRDDHDSTKKRGQIDNFEGKLEFLHKQHGQQIVGVMFFIDPDFTKNRNFYRQELTELGRFYGADIHLFYGRELFDHLGHPSLWDSMLSWFRAWRESLPDLPDVSFDKEPEKSFQEIKDLEPRFWRKILTNEKLWSQGIVKVLFGRGQVLKDMHSYFVGRQTTPYRNLAHLLRQRLDEYY